MDNRITLLFWLASFLLPLALPAQDIDESTVREAVLVNISEETDKRSRELEERIAKLDSEIKKIDDALKNAEGTEDIMVKLRERVSKLEALQMAQKQQELNIYDNNFQSAVINLVSMERELKPLVLFNSSRDFFTSLTEVSNPTTYPGYKEWFSTFKAYLEKNKSSDVVLNVTSSLLETVGDFSSGVSIVGPLSEGLFMSMSKFIQSFGNKKKELKKNSEKMFELTMTLGQYTVDKSLVETGWESINAELEGLQKLQAETLADIFATLEMDEARFQEEYVRETNALQRIDYLKDIQRKIKAKVEMEQQNNAEGWKDRIYYMMTTVQSLKIRFGNLTFKLKENIKEYEKLITKYEDNPLIGERVRELKEKLEKLSSAFDDTFNPQKYVDDAVRMYKR